MAIKVSVKYLNMCRELTGNKSEKIELNENAVIKDLPDCLCNFR